MADDALTDARHQALEVSFGLDEAAGFVLAGGAALIATGLSSRPT